MCVYVNVYKCIIRYMLVLLFSLLHKIQLKLINISFVVSGLIDVYKYKCTYL